MTQPALLIALGALATAFLALLALPAFRRRVEAGARRRLEAAMPMTLEAIQAGRDALRAEHAVVRQRLEGEAAQARDRESEQAVAAARAGEEARRLGSEKQDLARAVERLEAEGSALRASLEAERETGSERKARLAAQEAELEEARAALQRLGQDLEETTYLASSRQIELVARETEIEKLRGELTEHQAQGAGSAARLVESQSAIDAQARRSADAEARAEALAAEVFEAESRIERGRTDAGRLRRELAAVQAERDRIAGELVEARKERMGLELEFAGLNRQLSALFPGTVPGGDPATGLKAAAAERDRIEARLAALGRENRELRDALGRAPAAAETTLREEMLRLAAEVAALVDRLEGPDGAVARALAAPGPSEEGTPPSLADRIEALRGRS